MEWQYKSYSCINMSDAKDLISRLSRTEGWVFVMEALPGCFVFKRPTCPKDVRIRDASLIEYITPTSEHVGMRVFVRDCENQYWVERRLVLIRDHESAPFAVDVIGRPGRMSVWKQARVAVKR